MAQNQCLPLPRRRKRNDTDNTSEALTSDLSSMDAMDYLASVNLEASLLPDVFVASSTTGTVEQRDAHNWNSAPIDGSAAASHYLLSKNMQIIPPPTLKHLPRCTGKVGVNLGIDDNDLTMDEWINSTLSNFSSLRVYIQQCRAAGIGRSSRSYCRVQVPMSKDRVGWHIFCLGQDEARGNVGGYFQDDDSDEQNEDRSSASDGSDDYDNETTVIQSNANLGNKTWDNSTTPITGYRPSTALLCQFDQIIIRRVLSHHAYYLSEDWDFTESRGRWIYALLSRVEKPLHWDETSMLRGLLRTLCRLRADLDLNEQNKLHKDLIQKKLLSILNVLIVIIGIYFEQGGVTDCLMDVKNNPR